MFFLSYPALWLSHLFACSLVFWLYSFDYFSIDSHTIFPICHILRWRLAAQSDIVALDMYAQRRFIYFNVIRIFTGRILDIQECKISSCGQWRLWLCCRLFCLHLTLKSDDTVSHVAARNIILQWCIWTQTNWQLIGNIFMKTRARSYSLCDFVYHINEMSYIRKKFHLPITLRLYLVWEYQTEHSVCLKQSKWTHQKIYFFKVLFFFRNYD